MASSAKVPAVPSSGGATACTASRQHRHKKNRANGSNLVTSSIRWLLQQGTLAPKEIREATGQGPSRATQHRSDSLHQGKWQEASHNQDTQAPTLSPAAFDGSCSKEHLHPKKSEKPQAKAPAVRPSTGATACTKGSGRKHRTIKIPTSPDLASSSIRWLLQQGTLAPKEPGEATGQGPSRATQHRSDSLHQGKWHEASRTQDTQAPTLLAAAFDGSCRKAAARRSSKHTWHAVPRSPPQYMNRKSQCSTARGPGHRHRRGISRDLTSVMAEATTTAALGGGGSDSLWDVR